MHPHSHKFSLKYGSFKPSTIQNLFIILSALIQGKTANLYNLKDEIGKIAEKYKSKPGSHYRRLTRFFLKESGTQLWSAVLEYGLSFLKMEKQIFFLDATEWQIGKFRLHCLFLAFYYQGMAIPVYFKLYEHKGVLSQKERIQFIKETIIFCQIKILVADREFIGDAWFTFLSDASLDFVIRLRKGQYKEQINYKQLEKKALKRGKASSLIQIGETTFRLWVMRNTGKEEPLIYMLTTLVSDKNAPQIYRLRWKIETLFKHLKTNGYNLEDLRMCDLEKIRLLICLIILAFILSVLVAAKERKRQAVKKKRYKNETFYDSISVFKQGQSLLKQSFSTLRQFLEILQILEIEVKTAEPLAI
jgi:hypothetical protein